MVAELLRWFGATGIRRGLGGSKPWIVVGIVALGLRAIGRIAREDDPVLYRTVVRPGDVFRVTAGRPGDAG